MAQTGFQISCWGRSSVSANEPVETVTDAAIGTGNVVEGCFREYNYYSPVDTQATVSASGYFNANTAYKGVANDLVTGDLIKVYSLAENTYITYQATVTAGVVTVSTTTGIITTSGTITNAQILAGLYAHPVQIVAAPGATQMIVPTNATFSYIYGTVQFTGGGDIAFQYDSTVHGAGTNSLASVVTDDNIVAATSNQYQTLILVAQAWGSFSAIIGKGIFMSCLDGEFAAGDGKFEYTYSYRLASLV